MSIFPVQAHSKVLVVVKQTAFQMYQQLKAVGQAPLALRWTRLEDRDSVHRSCVEVHPLFCLSFKYCVLDHKRVTGPPSLSFF